MRLSALPGNITVSADLTGMGTDSVVNVTQVATIDRTVLEERMCALQTGLWLRSTPASGAHSRSPISELWPGRSCAA